VSEAGFTELELEEIAVDFRYVSSDAFWDLLVRLAGPLALAINARPDDERHETRAVLMQNVELYRVPDGSYSVPATT